MTTISPEILQTTLTVIEDDLPALVGEKWPTISNRVAELRQQLQNESDAVVRFRLADALIEALMPYPSARRAIQRGLFPAQALFGELTELGAGLGLSPSQLEKLNQIAGTNEERIILIRPNEEAISLKLANFDFKFGAVSRIAGSFIMSIKAISAETNSLYITGGVLLVLASLYEAFTVKIEEVEVSVFLGLITACGYNRNVATEPEILAATNAEREKAGKRLLTSDNLKDSLQKLARIKAIQKEPINPQFWQVIENHIHAPI